MPNRFPHPSLASPEGLLAIGGDLDSETLIEAYSEGIFPWPLGEEYPLTWFSPDPRGMLFLNELHIPHSLEKFIRKTSYSVHFNRNFSRVIEECAKSPHRKDGQKTWILPQMQKAYQDLHRAGFAFSVEIDYDEELAGGLYGVNLGYAIAGESMFYLKENGSKLALISLVKHLQTQNIQWVDTQMVTEVTELLGARNISRDDFLERLNQAKKQYSQGENISPNQIIFPNS